jgi:hypothetical protein
MEKAKINWPMLANNADQLTASSIIYFDGRKPSARHAVRKLFVE